MPVYKDGNKGKYKVKMSYKSWDGKTKWLCKRGFQKRSDAVEWENEYRNKIVGSMDMNLNDFTELYLTNIKERIKYTTMYHKEQMIRTRILPYLGTKPINQISTIDVINWQNNLLKSVDPDTGKKYSKSYLKTLHNQLSAMLNHARKFYKLQDNPAAAVGNMGTDKEIKINFWTQDEYKKFANVMMDKPIYYYAFEILYWCGLREGELLALTVDDIDFQSKEIDVNKTLTRIDKKDIITDPKTRKSKRRVRMPDFLVDELKDYLELVYQPNGKTRLFPINKSSLISALKNGAKKAGVKEIRVHDLRHSHVSLLIHLGYSAVAIGDRVGHESVYITFHYSHMFPSVQDDMVDKLTQINKEEK